MDVNLNLFFVKAKTGQSVGAKIKYGKDGYLISKNSSHATQSPEPTSIMVEHNGNIKPSTLEEIESTFKP